MFTFADARTVALAQALRDHPEGLTLYQLAAKMTPILPLRTIQRWVGRLVFAGLIVRRGRTHQVRYFAGKGRGALPVKKRAPKTPPVPVRRPEPEPPPAPAPARPVKPSRLPPDYQRVFDRAAPIIIRRCYVDDVAISELARAAVTGLHADTDLMNDFVGAAMNEFDALDRATALSFYQVTPDEWEDWRKQWCELRDLKE